MVNFALKNSVQTLENLGGNVRLVVFHPNYTPQHLLLSQWLENEKVAYVRFDGQALSADELSAQFDAQLSPQLEGTSIDTMEIIILDECDRAGEKAFEPFVKDLLAKVSARIIIASREIPPSIVTDDSLRAITGFVPSDKNLMLYDYAQRDDERSLLEVRAFGSGRVFLDGRAIDNWDGTLPRSLFFYLVDRGMVRRDDIFATFWPNLTVREATNVFHVTKRKISEVLGRDLTVYSSGFYRVSPEIELSYDVIQFTEMVQDSAVAEPDGAAISLQQAIALYRSPYLTTMDSEWVIDRRGELKQMYGEALIDLAQLKHQMGQRETSLGLYARAWTTAEEREDLVKTIMQLYQELERPEDALQAYERLEMELKEGVGIAPSSELQQLADELRARIS